jgi:hypothetical protein
MNIWYISLKTFYSVTRKIQVVTVSLVDNLEVPSMKFSEAAPEGDVLRRSYRIHCMFTHLNLPIDAMTTAQSMSSYIDINPLDC